MECDLHNIMKTHVGQLLSADEFNNIASPDHKFITLTKRSKLGIRSSAIDIRGLNAALDGVENYENGCSFICYHDIYNYVAAHGLLIDKIKMEEVLVVNFMMIYVASESVYVASRHCGYVTINRDLEHVIQCSTVYDLVD